MLRQLCNRHAIGAAKEAIIVVLWCGLATLGLLAWTARTAEADSILSLAMPQVDPPAMVESKAGTAPTSKMPGAAAGALVNGNASAFAQIDIRGLTFVAPARTVFTASGATVINNNPPRSMFPTPTMGMVNGFGDTKPKIAPSTLVAENSGPDGPTAPLSAGGMGKWDAQVGKAAALTADAVVQNAVKGYAAAFANDPYLVDPGGYDLSPVLDGSLLMSTNVSDPTSSAALVFLGQSQGLGDNNATLWSLTISLLGSSATPTVGFSSAPILGLNDVSIRDGIVAALDTSVAGQVTFLSKYTSTGYTLFSTTLSSSGPFQFGETFETDATNNFPVPEPSTFVLSGGGLAILAAAAGITRIKRRVRVLRIH
jgi:hypothetical protein